MISKSFAKLQTRLQKLAGARGEHIHLEDLIDVRAPQIEVIEEPFPHVIIDGFFKPDIYAALSNHFSSLKARGLSNGKAYDDERLHLFDINYDGYLNTPTGTLDPRNPLSLFYTLCWNRFFSEIFGQVTSLETDFAMHHHPVGDNTGFVHHDYADKSFDRRWELENGVLWHQSKGPGVKRRRIISLIFYLNNDGWRPGDGGETGLYSADQQTLIKKVEPVNNRMLAFQISPRSMHAFQANRTERNSLVQWFHLSPDWL